MSIVHLLAPSAGAVTQFTVSRVPRDISAGITDVDERDARGNPEPTLRTVADPSNSEKIELYWRAVNARDWDALATLLHKDYAWEMPQSGERVRGEQNNREMNQNYPAGLPDVEPFRITGSQDKWVTTPSWTVLKITGTGDDYSSESRAIYPDGSVWHAVDLFHFRDGKIRTQVAYYAPRLEAQEWRARWVERF